MFERGQLRFDPQDNGKSQNRTRIASARGLRDSAIPKAGAVNRRQRRTLKATRGRAEPAPVNAGKLSAPLEEERELGFGVWQKMEGHNVTTEIRDLPRVRAVLGDDLLVGFGQLFAATDRLDAFLFLMGLNQRHSPSPKKEMPQGEHHPDSVGAVRNNLTLAMMRFGTLHELSSATSTLDDANLGQLLAKAKDPEAFAAWKRLKTASHQWKRPNETDVRNQLAFHLGDREIFKKGLENWDTTDPLRVIIADQRSPASTLLPIGFELLRKGLGLCLDDFARLAQEDTKTTLIMDDAMAVFFGALRAKGADIVPVTQLIRPR